MRDTVEEAVAAVARGEMVVVVDSKERENEGDLVMAAELVSPESVNFMATYGRGLICVSMLPERLEALGIPPMTRRGGDVFGTAFHVSVDHRDVSRGVSASGRALTIRALADEQTDPASLVKPGHVFPLAYREGGVLARPGHTEASVDLAVLGGLAPAAVICEITSDDGTMARLPELSVFAERHGLQVLAISDLIAYRRRSERVVERMGEARVELGPGEFRTIVFRDRVDGREHVALVRGDLSSVDAPLVSVHTACLAGDVFGSGGCDCGRRLTLALERLAEARAGAVIYLGEASIRPGHSAPARDFGIAAQLLADLGISRMRLLGSDRADRSRAERYGLEVAACEPLCPPPEAVTDLRCKIEARKAEMDPLGEMARLLAVG